MNLAALLSRTETFSIRGRTDQDIQGLCYDSRQAKPGLVFIAVRGEKVDGAQFIPQAIAQGVDAVVVESGSSADILALPAVISRAVTCVVVRDARIAMADLAAAFYATPAASLNIAGITGTNGKTTTAFLIKQICEHAQVRCGLLGTVRYEIGDEILPASRTTPESLDVQRLLSRMITAGCTAAAMEVSSHALMQERVRNVDFNVAVFTNLTQDHLDYHGTMEAYFEAKARLFTGLAAQKRQRGTAVINADDRWGAKLIPRIQSPVTVVTYGMNPRADFRASNVRSDFNGTSYQLDALDKSYLVRSPFIGTFNVYNTLAAIAAASVLRVEVRTAVLALAQASPVPGRLEAVPGQRAFRVFVDYAHTDDALENAARTLRELRPERLLVVFGCGGNRDRAKRPRMGAAVEKYADFAIVTSDNPRKEDPAAIIDDILPGMPRGQYEVVVDRKEAIQRAVAMAQPRDIILIAGKGHENYQEFADRTVPFDDVTVASDALRHLGLEAS